MPKTYAYIRMSKDTSDAENQRFQILKTLEGKGAITLTPD
jgi:DNA invertase Pin-like site-specific DNA recombinase